VRSEVQLLKCDVYWYLNDGKERFAKVHVVPECCAERLLLTLSKYNIMHCMFGSVYNCYCCYG
jgi:hypothetical protein